MENDLSLALEGLKAKVLESVGEKSKAEVKAAIEEFEKKSKGEFDLEIKGLKEELEKTKSHVQVLQDQHDKQSVEMQRKSQTNEGKDFEEVLSKAVEANFDGFKKLERREKGAKVTLEIDMKGVKAVGAMSIGNVTGTTVWNAQSRPGIIMNPNNQGHLRTVLSVYPSGPGTDYYFMRENGAGEGSIAPTAEATASATPTTQATGLKPQFDQDLIEASVKFEVIAGWMLISRKALNNIPGIVGYLNRRLPERLLDVEDQQVLYGTGTSPEIKGILTSGNFVTGSAAGATPLAEKIINDLSLLEDTHKRTATDILMRPSDYYGFFKQKASGSGEYDLPQNVVFVGDTLYISGIPVTKTHALTANDYVVGDFDNGAELHVQEAMMIEFFEQDSTNVRTNQVTVRIEETIALPVFGNNFFVKGSSATS